MRATEGQIKPNLASQNDPFILYLQASLCDIGFAAFCGGAGRWLPLARGWLLLARVWLCEDV